MPKQKKLKPAGHPEVKLAVTDIDGILRGKYLRREKVLPPADGSFGFCDVVFGWDSGDVCYDNTRYTGWHTGYPDAVARIDFSTERRVPWEQDIPFFLADFWDAKGGPLAVCPRQVLKRVLARAARAGFQVRCGMEFEWFNFRETPQSLAEKDFHGLEPLTPGMFGYSLLRASLQRPFVAALLDELRRFRVPLEGLHTETGPGVFEAALACTDALEAADRAVLFKSAAREIGYRFGLLPSFMARWNPQLPGCSGHTHLSLWDTAGKRNLFHDRRDPQRMSPIFRQFIAGSLHCLPELLAFFAPTVNSYKRLVDGYWAPTRATWGLDNRTTALRALPGGAGSSRLEVRVPGSDVNPYLAIAAAIAGGLHGIEHGLELTEQPVTGSAYRESEAPRLARTLAEATARLALSAIARDYLGDGFVDHFVQTREWEWRCAQEAVTDWELRRYLEII